MSMVDEAVQGQRTNDGSQMRRVPDLPSHAELQEIVEIAAQICGAPISLISLLDAERQWFEASVGTHLRETRRDIAFCAHTVIQEDLFVVEDTLKDIRFAANPLVTGDPEMRFYAGMPLISPDGETFGTLCVIDQKPRQLTVTQMRALRVLANQVRTSMQLRAEHRMLVAALRERDHATTRLHANERMFQTFMNNGPLISYLKDAEGRYLFYNARFAERCHVTMQEWLGRTDFEVFPENLARNFREHDQTALDAGRLVISTEMMSAPDGECSTWRSYKFPCEDEVGQPLLAGFSFDVTDELQRQEELAQTKRELERLGSVDPLTNLPKRQVFDERLELEFDGAQMRRNTLSLVVMDVDNIRQRNQRLGKEAGDAALKTIGAILKECITEADLAVRLGGAEFVLLLPETTNEEAKALAERVQREMRKLDWGIAPVTLSVGIATNRDAKRGGRQLFCFADDAMYTAKMTGKNRVVVYEPR